MNALFAAIERLSPLTPEARAALAACFRGEVLPAGTYFVRAGEFAPRIAFVRSGILRACFTAPNGTEYSKTFFQTGDFMGVSYAYLRHQPSHLDLQALTDCELWVATYAHVEKLFDQYVCLERFARRLWEAYFIEKEQREIDLVLLDAGTRYEQFARAFPDIVQQVPQYIIASHLGITPTQLSRIRRKMGKG